MKTCKICTTENAADAVTCGACGEGSFDESAPAPAATVSSEPDTVDESAPAPSRKGRR